MPTFSETKKLYGNKGTIGQQVKKMSDDVMEETWDNNIQSKLCYIYDYKHDDHPEITTNIPHDKYTTKTPIEAKFIVQKYWTISSDQPDYHIEFKPSQKFKFQEGDPLYYYEEGYRNVYGMTFPIGMYIDIPNERGEYERWLIYGAHGGNQFLKYSVLKCDYYLHWIEVSNNERIKRKMWCVLRSQNSYNSGLWTNYTSTLTENQDKLALPLNDLTESLYYVDTTNKMNQRVVVSAPTKHPLVWQISKVEALDPMGIQVVTIYQDLWNNETDYVDKEEQAAGDLFAMYADYYSSTVTPTTDTDVHYGYDLKLSCNSDSIKAGGSYKLITATLYNSDGEDITDRIESTNWTCYFRDEDITDDESLITWLEQDNVNEMKIKFANNRSYYTEILTVCCTTTINDREISGEIQLEIVAL